MLPMRVELAVLADAINFINEDDRRLVFRSLAEKLSDPFCANTNKHFSEIASVHAEELCVGFARDRLGQHGFAGSRRADEEDSLRQAAAETLILFRVA